MARRGSLSFGTLNPFGGSNLSFGSFSVGGSAGGGADTVDPSRQAYLEFQRVETDWNAGRIDDASYQAAYQSYMGYLDAGSSEMYNAQARLDDMQYSLARDAMLSAVSRGEATWSDVVAFDAGSLAGLTPGSKEYRDREARLFASQNNEFSVAERAITTDLQAGRITNTQAMQWYANSRQFYTGNGDLLGAIDATISALGTRVVAEQDQLVIDQWQAGTIGIADLVAYGQKAIAEEPIGNRAEAWAKNIDTAKGQAVETSLMYRYELTEEWRDLAAFVADAKDRPTGSTSTRTSFRTYVDANGNWVTKPVTTSTYHGPSASEQEAYAKRQAQVAEAKKRMAQIEKQVGGLPGGWVNEDDILRNLADQQAKVSKSNPEWINLQKKIDYYTSRKAADEESRKAGLLVNPPTTSSERTADLTVGGFERPVAASTGKVSVSSQPKPSGGGGGGVAAGGGGAGVSGGGTVGGGSGTGGTAAARPQPGAVGVEAQQAFVAPGDFLYLAAGASRGAPGRPTEMVVTAGGVVSEVYKKTGLPVGMAPKEFESFRSGLRNALLGGETSWVDPVTQNTYLVPADPEKRLDIILGIGNKYVELKRSMVAQMEAGGKDTSASMKAYTKALADVNSDAIQIMNHPTSTLPGSIPKSVRDTFSPGLHVANPVAVTIDYMDRAKREADWIAGEAQAALDRGDLEAAYAFIQSGNAQVLSSEGFVAQAVQWAGGQWAGGVFEGAVEDQLNRYMAAGGVVREKGQIAADVEKVRSLFAAEDKGTPEAENWIVDTFSGLNKMGSQFTGIDENGRPLPDGGLPLKRNPQTGQPIINPLTGSFDLEDGYVYTIRKGTGGDKIVIEYQPNEIDYESNTPRALDPSKSLVMLQVGATWKPVLVDHKVRPVGRVVDSAGVAHEIRGKVISISFNGNEYVLAQNPLNPKQWLPITDKGLEIRLPMGVGVVPGSSQLGKVGTQLTFEMRDQNGRIGKYMLAPGDDGTYALWQEKTIDGQKQMNPLYTAADPQFAGILSGAGIALDSSGFSGGQKLYAGTGLPGVWAGDAQKLDAMGRGMREAYASMYASPSSQGPRMDTYGGITATWSPTATRLPGPYTVNPATGFRVPTPLAAAADRVGYATQKQTGTVRIVEPGAPPASTYNAPIYSPYLASIIPTQTTPVVANQAATARLTGLAAVYAGTPTINPATGFTTPRPAAPKPAARPVGRSIPSTQKPSTTTRQIIEPVRTPTPTITPPPRATIGTGPIAS